MRAAEWEALRETRLRALRDAPDAFATTFHDARSRPLQWWGDWAERSSDGPGQAVFLAWQNVAIGICGAFAEAGAVRVFSMWVDPGARGRGIGWALLDAVVVFAGDAEVLLSVTDGNEAARRLYERYGFVETGLTEPLRSGSSLLVRELRLERAHLRGDFTPA